MTEHDDAAPLSSEEIAAVHKAVAVTVGRHPGEGEWPFAKLFARWRDVVAVVEDGYPWCAPELDNDAFCRRALAEVWPLLPDRLARLWQGRLDELDARFRLATIAWPGHLDEQEWWRRRIPRRLEAEADDPLDRGWPMGWDMLPFPKPQDVNII